MSRPIDADELWKDFISADKDDIFSLEDVEEILDHAPTIELCDDAISRRDALKSDVLMFDSKSGVYWTPAYHIENLPSVAPSRPSGEWISCEERLPNEDGTYLVTYEWVGKTGTKYIEIEGIDFEHGRWGCHDYKKVTAWMPLPEPWKGADDE